MPISELLEALSPLGGFLSVAGAIYVGISQTRIGKSRVKLDDSAKILEGYSQIVKDLQTESARHQKRIVELEEEKVALTIKIDALTTELALLKAQVAVLETERTNLFTRIEQVEHERSELKTRVSELETELCKERKILDDNL